MMNNETKKLIDWLQQSKDFYLSDKIEVRDIEKAGKGIVLAQGQIRNNEILISIPSSYQINFNTVLYHISKFNKDICFTNITIDHETEELPILLDDPRSILYNVFQNDTICGLTSFQLISLYVLMEWKLLPELTHGTIISFWQPFFDVWPVLDDLKSIPALWKTSRISPYKHLLPFLTNTSKVHCERISNLILKDWEILSPIIKQWMELSNIRYTIDEIYEIYLHIYFIINSRCLYAEVPLKKDDRTSKFTLVPYVDFINHSEEMDRYCYPKTDYAHNDGSGLGQFVIRGGSYTYKTIGEQILFNYGPHSNDFLLNEYGFTLGKNCWDTIDISTIVQDMIIQKNDIKMMELLKKNGYWGEYMINHGGFNYTSIVAISLYATNDYDRVGKLILGYLTEDYFLPKIKPLMTEMVDDLINKYITQKEDLINLNISSDTDSCVYNLLNIFKGYINILENVDI